MKPIYYSSFQESFWFKKFVIVKPVVAKYLTKYSQIKKVVLSNAGVYFIHSTTQPHRRNILREETDIANTTLVKIYRTLY